MLKLKLPFLPWILLLLVVLTNSILGCSSKSHKGEHKFKHNYYYHFNDPRHRGYVPIERKHRHIIPNEKLLIPEYALPVPITSCGKTLCSNVPNYPLVEINEAIDRARNVLRPGGTIISFQKKGITYQNFTSKYDTFWFGEPAPDHRFVDETDDCKEHVNTIYPQEGCSIDDGKTYYVVNVPTLYRGLTKMECESHSQMCIRSNDLSTESRRCRQMYRKEQLLVVPTDKFYIDVEDFELKMFYVPTGCACITAPSTV